MDAQSILAALPEGAELLRPVRIATLLDWSPARVYGRIKARELRGIRVGGTIRVRRSDFATWLAEHVTENRG
jgi:excisionase family DNA binding protein